MTRICKDEIYDRLSRLLTNYEVPDTEAERTTESELYTMLVEIQNNWDELTGKVEQEDARP